MKLLRWNIHKSPVFLSSLIFLIISLWVVVSGTSALPDMEDNSMSEYAGKINAPEFPSGMEWLNTRSPLSLRQLRGKVVLLDFWTYCCINCIHIIPDLKRLEKKYEHELVVIGVHSAKFTTEKETDNIRQAILRYEIEHPVVNDRDFVIWRAYSARAWPTLVLINPVGKIVGYHSGEGIYEPFDEVISKVIAEFDAKGLLDREPLRFDLERYQERDSLLSFPGKVLAYEASDRLFIADSNHNRIIVASIENGSVLAVVGNGGIGLADGGFAEASFNHPQGMAFDGQNLYVADTENHAIRQVDFQAQRVTTIAGTGEQAGFINPGNTSAKTRLNSPWDVVLVEDKLYIAMAGSHQLWVMSLKTGRVEPYAGSGREARIDGELKMAALAQPSGITTDGKKLYFADSETSSIRSADLPPGDKVQTIVGLDLFEFGDVDGAGNEVRLQHPLGVTYHKGVLYVADTYNNKIKRLDPKDRSAQTSFGTGEAGLLDGKKPLFDEPGGLSIAHERLYIADTNNHVIRVADLKTMDVSTFELKDVQKLRPQAATMSPATNGIEIAPQTVQPGNVTLMVDLELPKDYKLTPSAPSKVVISAGNTNNIQFQGGGQSLTFDMPEFPLKIPVQAQEGEAKITAHMDIYYCQTDKESLCYFQEVQLIASLNIQAGEDETTVNISYSLEEK